jgi:hypothetical protein
MKAAVVSVAVIVGLAFIGIAALLADSRRRASCLCAWLRRWIHKAPLQLRARRPAYWVGSARLRLVSQPSRLWLVEIHRELMTAAARWMKAAKLASVLSARMAMRLNSLSLPKKFSIR